MVIFSRKITRNGSLNLKVNLKNIDVFNDPDGDLSEKSSKEIKYNWFLNDEKLATTDTPEYYASIKEGTLNLEVEYKDRSRI